MGGKPWKVKGEGRKGELPIVYTRAWGKKIFPLSPTKPKFCGTIKGDSKKIAYICTSNRACRT